jgi:hypothetical protein
MKKCLLLTMLVMLIFGITRAQNEGYSWTFGAGAPYNSTPAMTGSATSYPLTLLDFSEDNVTEVSEVVGLGTSCAAAINVGEYGAPPTYFLFGLVMENAPQYVGNVYTIEMTVKFLATGNYHRLIGFSDHWTAPGTHVASSDDGIYIGPDPGQLLFRVGGVDTYIGTANITANTWHHITLIRNANNLIQFYLNGVYQDAYSDAALNFVPKLAVGNRITFFKDEDTGSEEVGGSIAKLSIYGRALTESEIVKKTFENACNTSVLLSPNPDEGHQWAFTGASPFVSTPAVTGSLGTYNLSTIGTGPITTGTSEAIGLGASCTAPAPIGAYPLATGLSFVNSPRYIYDTYSIEMAVNIADIDAGLVRLVGFHDLSSLTEGNYGIYANTLGEIAFVSATTTTITASPLTENTWFHLMFTRDAAGTISYYQNGVLIGTYPDPTGVFMPQTSNGNMITLLKDDDDGEESSGKITKTGIFNAVLPLTDVEERFHNICNANLVILPVTMKLFTAVKVDKEVKLTWTTAIEENNLGFEVQRSKDGANYTTIGFVKGSGSSTQDVTYTFTDPAPLPGNNYYRLKQIDITNFATFSSIRRINMDKLHQDVQLFPNPARDIITITNIKAGDHLSVFNTHGNLVHRKVASSGQESIAVGKLASGVYLLQVTDRDNNKRIIRFTKF